MSEKAVRNAINKYGGQLTFDYREKSGRKSGSSDPKLDKKVTLLYQKNPEMCTRDMAKKVRCSLSMVQRIKKCCKSVLKWYEENDMRIEGKNINPPNCPELRPIETKRKTGYGPKIKCKKKLCKL